MQRRCRRLELSGAVVVQSSRENKRLGVNCFGVAVCAGWYLFIPWSMSLRMAHTKASLRYSQKTPSACEAQPCHDSRPSTKGEPVCESFVMLQVLASPGNGPTVTYRSLGSTQVSIAYILLSNMYTAKVSLALRSPDVTIDRCLGSAYSL